MLYFEEFINENKKNMVDSEDSFREYAEKYLKKAHGDDYDQDKADKLIDALLKRKKDEKLNYGSLIGILRKG